MGDQATDANPDSQLDEALKALAEKLPPQAPLPAVAAPAAGAAGAAEPDGDEDEDADKEAMKAFVAQTLTPAIESALDRALKPIKLELAAARQELRTAGEANSALKSLVEIQGRALHVMGERMKSISGNPTGGANHLAPGISIPPAARATGGTAPAPGATNGLLNIDRGEVAKALAADEITDEQAMYLEERVLPSGWTVHDYNRVFPGGRFQPGGEG